MLPTAVRVFPPIEHAGLASMWAGLYEMTPDRHPIIGGSPVEGFLLANGFSGHGFQHSPAAGRILADVLAGRDPGLDLTPFALERFAASQAGGEHYVV